jgi:hypothetical protein
MWRNGFCALAFLLCIFARAYSSDDESANAQLLHAMTDDPRDVLQAALSDQDLTPQEHMAVLQQYISIGTKKDYVDRLLDKPYSNMAFGGLATITFCGYGWGIEVVYDNDMNAMEIRFDKSIGKRIFGSID